MTDLYEIVMKYKEISDYRNSLVSGEKVVAIYNSKEAAKEQVQSLFKTVKDCKVSEDSLDSNIQVFFVQSSGVKDIKFVVRPMDLKLNH